MTLSWTDKVNNVDDVMAEDINGIAHAVTTAESDILQHTNDINAINTKLANIYTQQDAVRKFAYLEAAIGDSIQIKDTIAAVLAEMEIRGETTVRRVVFSGGNTVDMINGGSWPFSNGASLTWLGLDTAVSANNKTTTVTTVSGSRMSFPSSTFTNGVSLNGTVTDGTTTVYITVSPDHPQTLDSLHNFDIVASGKNRIDLVSHFFSRYACTSSYVNDVLTATTTSAENANIKYKLLLKAGTYTLKTESWSNARSIAIYDELSTLVNTIYSSGGSVTFTLSKDTTIEVRFHVSMTVGVITTFTKVQLEKGSTATAYEPYVGQKVSFTPKDTAGNPLYAHGIPLTYNSDGSVATWVARDVVFQDTDSKRKLMPVFNTVVYDGDENITYYNSDIYRFPISPNGKHYTTAVAPLTCHKFKAIPWASRGSVQNNQIYEGFDVGQFFIKLEGFGGDANAVKTWLASNPVTIVYERATPGAPIELHADNQAALNAAAYSYDGQTNIMLSTWYGQLYAKVAKNITKVIDDIKAAIALLG